MVFVGTNNQFCAFAILRLGRWPEGGGPVNGRPSAGPHWCCEILGQEAMPPDDRPGAVEGGGPVLGWVAVVPHRRR